MGHLFLGGFRVFQAWCIWVVNIIDVVVIFRALRRDEFRTFNVYYQGVIRTPSSDHPVQPRSARLSSQSSRGRARPQRLRQVVSKSQRVLGARCLPGAALDT